MAFIQFGDISAEIVAKCKTLHISSKSVAQTTFVAAQQHLLNYGRTVIQEREERQRKAFDTLQAFFDERLQVNKNSTIVKERRSGTLKLKKFTLQQTVEFERRKARREAKNKLPDVDQVVSSISIAGGPPPSKVIGEENNRKKCHTTPSRKKKIVHKRLHLNEHQLEKLVKNLRSIASKKQLNVEVISTRVNKGKYVQFGDKTFFQLQTKHHLNKIELVDLHLNEVNTRWIRFLSMTPHWNREECTLDIHRGHSGCVFNIDRLIGPHHGGLDGMFIVRGDRNGTLLDARYRVYRETLNSIEHYSGNAENFWRGFTNKYVEYRKPCDHECKSDFNVERVGEMAAIVWQTLVPSGKITCKQCAQDYADMTRDDISNRIEKNFTQYHAVLSSTYADMLYPAKFVQMYASTMKSVNNNYDGFTKIKHLIGDRTEAPFTHINKVNEILIKGSAATKDELSEATSALLEVARYQNNRTENVQQGSLKFFRNKISGKAKVNMKLMCDNQLDENGNFKWGKREYHAKRFFTNYLNRIEPSKGYAEFEIRRFPNGTRKLAIGNLIVSTNFENIRNQLEGEAINALPLSNECISKYANQFKYPCCCITHDDGTPVLSNVFMPMKGHLAIGNTGDAKYVDLPQSTEMEMYISKDGYCYINIFLAMLVNVNENDAKDFTKIIRDRLIPELGVWPTMMDLATACYYLTLFFPDTISAELPQILVDHATTTLHVLDSYGSKSTGYHVLKADTIGQLIWFAHAKLDSTMKHYKVGGVLEAGETRIETCCCGVQIEVVGSNSVHVDDLIDGTSKKGITSNFFSRNNQLYPHNKVMSKAKGWDQKLDAIINLLDMDCNLFNHCLIQKFESGGEVEFNSGDELCYPPNNEVLVLNVYGCATVGLACIYGTHSFEVDGTCYFIMPNGFQQTHKHNIIARTPRLGLTFKSTRELNNIRNNEFSSLQRAIEQQQVTEADEQILIKSLIKSLYRPQTLEKLLLDNPYLVILSMVSPGVILALHNSGALEWALSNLLQRNIDLIVLYASLQALARKVSVARSLEMQNRAISMSAQSILDAAKIGEDENRTHAMIRNFLIKIITRNDSDERLHDLGYKNLYNQSQMYLEKNYLTELEMAWQELTWLEKLRAISFTRKWSIDSTKFLHPTDTADMKGRYSVSPTAHLQRMKSTLKSQWSRGREGVRNFIQRKKTQVFNSAIQIMNGLVPNIFHIINMCIVMNLLISISSATSNMIREYKEQKQRTLQAEEALEFELMCRYFVLYEALHGRKPTQKEFLEYVQEKDAKAHAIAVKYLAQQERVELQARSSGEAQLERIVAFMALIMMVFSPERSDGIYRTLNKLKGLVRTAEEPVELQGLDDITDILNEKQQTVDFELAGNEVYETTHLDKTFKFWWDKQITHGRTVPHYNTEGTYMEFTRATAVHVANEVAHSEKNDFLIKGAVGSGKSTGLPYHLSKKGSVLVIEPTRPLAENVCRQLQSDPFFASPNLRMRGATVFGSSPITIMTSGYALHYLANNVDRISEYKFVIIDECHVHDANAMAFRCLLHEYATDCKVLKVSATPPGRTTEFETQYPVALRSEESLSFQQFVQQQGTGSNADVTRNGDNILVYVASYNEVDTLSKLLTDKGHRVTKVDGRTMKVGKVEILTQGTPGKKHFVVATNIIENGVTLDVDVVVDFGVKVVPILDSDNRMIRYQKKSISYGERIQRLGRVGRHKAGTALKIGITEKGVQETPQMIATEAAFSCFAYGLPVMTGNVSTSLLSNCTVRQARSMMKFELNIFFMVCLIRFDGSIHAGVHELLKTYKLRESSMVLNKMAIPYGNSTNWLSARQYNMVGQRLDIEEDVRIPFFVNDIPERLYEKLWKLVLDNKGDAGFGRCVSSNVCKIAYTLKTDLASIQRTVKIIDGLLQEEREKEAYFTNVTSNSCTFSNFSLTSITNAIKSRYATSHTLENISTLIEAKDKLLHFLHSEVDGSEELWQDEEKFARKIKDNGVLENVILQGRNEIAQNLKLKGKWNSSLITRDVLMLAGVFVGGVWMLYENFKSKWHESLELQGKGKRQRQKLKFQRDRDMKTHFHINANDETLEHYYGEAYTKKGKKSGKQHGMGKKNRRFVNMYERDEDDFTMIRFVDPVTGKTIDDSVYFDMGLIQGQFGEYRRKLYDNDEIDQASLKKGIEAYVIKDFATAALKADLSPHKPLLVSNVTNNIMGFPEREHELRQTGAYIIVDPSRIPAQNEIEEEENLRLEGKGLINTMRDYNPIASVICSLNNETNGEPYMLYGIGFGSYIITSSHLFQRNNGVLKIKSRHGYYECPNTTQLLVKPLKDRDMILIRMPKDFPPFPQKLKFRQPVPQEMACMVGSLFQDKSITSTVSGQSHVVPKGNGWMWKHWISTQRGQCGLPLVSTKDGYIIGIHTAASKEFEQNYFTSFPEDFESKFLLTSDHSEWVRHWKFNADNSVWGGFNLVNCKPEAIFKPRKEVKEINVEEVLLQGAKANWMEEQLNGNLMAVATCPSQLVTKHVVKGKCPLFEVYLSAEPNANAFFKPLMGAYQKSALNRDAYAKDLLKYAKATQIGNVDTVVFEGAVRSLKAMFLYYGFQECDFVTDEEAIFGALNMKSAVGALYSGKKRDYFESFTQQDKENILKESCKRLYLGKLGVWNGSMKAELRPKEKVVLNKTRTFTAAPVDTLLSGKVCVDDFNNQFYSLNIKAPWAVGMTKFFCGWNELLMSLPDDWIYCDADGSQFDSSLSPYLINAVLEVRLEFMEKWDIGEEMLKNLYTEIVYTPVLTPDSTIVKKCKGNNSGQPSTVVDNTMMVILAMIYTLEKLGVKYTDQHKMIRYFVTGDDLLIAIEPNHEHLLDNFSKHFSDLGLNYEFSVRTRKREDLWFMSHCGILREGIYIPKLEQERIVSILEWDRSKEPVHRLEAICAAMIEAWGYDDLLTEIRKFYAWVLEQAPYKELAKEGKAPYLAETALRNLYLSKRPTEDELLRYAHLFEEKDWSTDCDELIELQGDDPTKSKNKDKVVNAGERQQTADNDESAKSSGNEQIIPRNRDQDVNVGTTGTGLIPRIKPITNKLRLPKIKGKEVLDLEFLLKYKPQQDTLSNSVATDTQFAQWYEGVKRDYDISDDQMGRVLDGLMVWCIENGTSPNLNGVWVMMDGEEQVEFNIKPLIDHAKPTFRQIMARFSDAAEAYIAMRNSSEPYMPRYGRIRNLKNANLARYAFDFYQVTSSTPDLAREVHHQMKAAALKGTTNKTFGLDGKVSNNTEDTERHTVDDVKSNTHSFRGMGENW